MCYRDLGLRYTRFETYALVRCTISWPLRCLACPEYLVRYTFPETYEFRINEVYVLIQVCINPSFLYTKAVQQTHAYSEKD